MHQEVWAFGCTDQAPYLRAMGYDVRDLGDGERILVAAIIEMFSMNDGELEPLTPGSTRPVASTATHAGIVKVMRFGFSLA